jgi:hypothetical protein
MIIFFFFSLPQIGLSLREIKSMENKKIYMFFLSKKNDFLFTNSHLKHESFMHGSVEKTEIVS